MVPKIHKFGTSFKGAAQYVLHDVGTSDSADRVAWTATLNLPTDDPDLAWRVMAATHYDAPRLKEMAGIKNTGRKSAASVMHITLSWPEADKDTLTPEEMTAAAEATLAYLKADDRQAIIAAHTDTKHPHIHIIVNRVSLDDGRMLSSSNNWKKVQAWALKYEQERGRIDCPQREINARLRKQGLKPRYKDRPRSVVELEQLAGEIANDNDPAVEATLSELRSGARKLGARNRALRARHREAWSAFEATQKAERSALKAAHRQNRARATREMTPRFSDEWLDLEERLAWEHDRFERRETTTLGALRNAMRAAGQALSVINEGKRNIVSDVWDALRSAARRRDLLERRHNRERAALRKRQQTALRAALAPLQAEYKADRLRAYKKTLAAHEALSAAQATERAELESDRSAFAKIRQTAMRTVISLLPASHSATKRARLERMKGRAASTFRERAAEQDNEQDPDYEQ